VAPGVIFTAEIAETGTNVNAKAMRIALLKLALSRIPKG
jgi:hypothetical protein